MGFKVKGLGAPFRAFTANLPPMNLTAGVPVAELYLGLYGRVTLAAGAPMNLATALEVIDEVVVTRRGETVIDIENGLDLLALILAPWNDHIPGFVVGGSSGHYIYVKGLTLPCNFPVGALGEFQLTVYNADNANMSAEVLSVAEGQGYYQANELGLNKLLETNHFHIVKRLYTPTATGWNSGFDIGTEGWLVGVLIFQTTEEGKTVAKTSTSLYEVELTIGGESVIRTDVLTLPSHQGARAQPDLLAAGGADSGVGVWSILEQFVYLDFRKQPWDCRGKSVVLKTNAGTDDAIRAYPIYLVAN